MPYLARVLVVMQDPRVAQRIMDGLRARGLFLFSARNGAEALRLARQLLTDVVIIDDLLPDGDGCDFVDMLHNDPDTGHIPVLMLGGRASSALRRRSLAVGVDELLIGTYDEGLIAARMSKLVRLGIMQAELRRRAATARSFRVEIDRRRGQESRDGPPVLLLAAQLGEDLDDVADILQSRYRLLRTAGAAEAAQLLHEQVVDTLVLSFDGGDREDWLGLALHVRDTPALYDVPVLGIGQVASAPDVQTLIQTGIDDLISRPFSPDELHGRVLSALRRRRLRRSLTAMFASLEAPATIDAETGAFQQAFLRVHLSRLVFEASKWDKPLSIATVSYRNLSLLIERRGPAAAQSVMARAADTLKRLVRVEDLIARADDNTLVAVLTDTPGDRSLKALHRIAGSLATTDYGLAGLPTAPIWMQMGHASLEPSDTADSLLLRARQILL
ncbi:GGDEF domain-containing protein [Tistrella bauzanensis]|uniref:GGDEF domain-containing protein n=1 Tax=Tistrella bauzanensis TaxID=657419 RepID=A0ABQ1ILM6_9PROT|nr:response regulator [Tistrella bauzanensis]GGB42225.1 GGDEF domain-containing protein [Tistrella bauzanensis]